ncbi:MAG: acyltransferase [Alkalimonas sp.]|nr:acyltransferase [Alkalimonas sp.]
MMSTLPPWVLVPISFSLFVLNLVFWGLLVTLLSLIRLLLPFHFIRRFCHVAVHGCYSGWIAINAFIIRTVNNLEWQEQLPADGLSKQQWYLLIANHQSWLDVVLLAQFTYGRMPLPKFFLKQELKWVPFVGLGAWALGMPFMRRYSKAQQAANPQLKGHDIESTRRSCEVFRHQPTTIINFVEGTRFSRKKQQLKQSPFQYLLPPKAGGIAFTLASMGEQFDAILDVTILYPDNPKHIVLAMLAGKLKRVVFQVERLPVSQQLIGDYFHDDAYRQQFQHWLNQRWQHKDTQIAAFHQAQQQAQSAAEHQSTANR